MVRFQFIYGTGTFFLLNNEKNIFRSSSLLEDQGNPKVKQVGKPLQDANFLNTFISEDSLFG